MCKDLCSRLLLISMLRKRGSAWSRCLCCSFMTGCHTVVTSLTHPSACFFTLPLFCYREVFSERVQEWTCKKLPFRGHTPSKAATITFPCSLHFCLLYCSQWISVSETHSHLLTQWVPGCTASLRLLGGALRCYGSTVQRIHTKYLLKDLDLL